MGAHDIFRQETSWSARGMALLRAVLFLALFAATSHGVNLAMAGLRTGGTAGPEGSLLCVLPIVAIVFIARRIADA
jgi:hypothetical protein